MDHSKLLLDNHHSRDLLVDHIFLEESFVSSNGVSNINNNLKELSKHSTSDSNCYHQSSWRSNQISLVRRDIHDNMYHNRQNSQIMILNKLSNQFILTVYFFLSSETNHSILYCLPLNILLRDQPIQEKFVKCMCFSNTILSYQLTN